MELLYVLVTAIVIVTVTTKILQRLGIFPPDA